MTHCTQLLQQVIQLIWRDLHIWGQKCKANGVHDTVNHFACNLAKCSPILEIFSPAEWMINVSKETHHTLNSWLWFIINCNMYFRMMPFSDIHISQGSVATCLKRGGIFKHKFVANLLLSPLVKKFWKSDNSWWNYGQEFGVLFFWLTV